MLVRPAPAPAWCCCKNATTVTRHLWNAKWNHELHMGRGWHRSKTESEIKNKEPFTNNSVRSIICLAPSLLCHKPRDTSALPFSCWKWKKKNTLREKKKHRKCETWHSQWLTAYYLILDASASATIIINHYYLLYTTEYTEKVYMYEYHIVY